MGIVGPVKDASNNATSDWKITTQPNENLT